MTRKLTDILLTLGDSSVKPSHQTLVSLSDLNAQEMAQFQAAWSTYGAARRLELIETLAALAEDHVELDYRSIFRWALTDADPAVRVCAIEGLWEDERPLLIPTFRTLLQRDRADEVRAAAAVALGSFVLWGETGVVDSPLVEDAVKALWDSYHNEEESLTVRRRALEGISASAQPGVSRLIENALYSPDRELHASALFAMGRNADPRWVPYLVPELEQDDPELRLEAVRALGELEARTAVRPLIHLIAVETDMEVRLAALASLGQIGGPDARRALEAATEWDDDAIVTAAEAALEELMSSDGSTFDLINQVLGIEEDDGEQDLDDYYDDLLDEELRDLLDEGDLQ